MGRHRYHPSPTPAEPVQDNQGKTAGKQKSGKQDTDDPSSNWWLIGSTVVTALATIAIAYLGYRQWLTLRDHHSVMDRQAGYIRDALAQTQASIVQATR